MNNEVAVHASVDAEITGFEMKPRTLKEAMDFCELMANSDLVPTTYRGKPGNIMVAIQMGSELGLTPMRALRCIAVINGRASMWGDELLAMVLASPVCEYVSDKDSSDKEGVCRTKRKGCVEQISRFTLEDAKRAGLLGKQGPWQTNTSRMLKLRARGFALRDTFADVLAGLVTVEEALDIPLDKADTMPEAAPPLTLKDKLKAKVEQTTEQSASRVTNEPDADADARAQAQGAVEAPSHAEADALIAQRDLEHEYRARFTTTFGAEANTIQRELVADARLTHETKDRLYKDYAKALKTKAVT